MLYICYDYGLDYLLGIIFLFFFFGDEKRFLVLRIKQEISEISTDSLRNQPRFAEVQLEVKRATCEQKRFVERSHNYNDD